MKKLSLCLLLLSSITFTTSCSSDSESSSESTKTGLFKFYNASINSNEIEFYMQENSDEDETRHSIIEFADVSGFISLEVSSYNVIAKRVDSTNNETLNIAELSANLETDMHSFFAITGDVEQPSFFEFQYDSTSIEELDPESDQFELYVANLMSKYDQVDVYYSKDDSDFSSAIYLTSLGSNNFSELNVLAQDNYKFYLTESGTMSLVFESEPVSFSSLQTFVLITRDDPGLSGVALDQISNSTIVNSFKDVNILNKLNFYASLSLNTDIDIHINGIDEEPEISNLAMGSLSASLSLAADTYLISSSVAGESSSILVPNLLVDVRADQALTIFNYLNADDAYQTLVVEPSSRQILGETTISVVNIGEPEQDVSFYFVALDESLSTARYIFDTVDYSEHVKQTVEEQTYKIVVTTMDDNGNLRSLDETDFLDFDPTKSHIVVLEPSETSISGYQVSVISQ